MKVHVLALTLTLACTAVLAQETSKTAATPPVEVAGEPSHHLKIENEYIRAYFVEVAQGQSTLMHHHGVDYVGVAFGAAEVDAAVPDGTVKHVTFQDGQVTYAPAGVVHAVTDKGSTPFQNATIELLQNQGHPVCVKNCESDPRAKDWPALPPPAKVIGYGDTFRIGELTVKPHQPIPSEEAGPHLAIFLTDIHAQAGGDGAQPMEHAAHDMVFHGAHPDMKLTNFGTQDVRIVFIQFKPVKP